MKKTWKYVLAALAICTSLGGSLVAQTDDGVVVLSKPTGRGQSPGNFDGEGAVRLGGPAAMTAAPSAVGGVVPVEGFVESYPPTIEPTGVDYGPYPPEPVDPSVFGEFGAAGSVGYAVSDDPRDILFRVGYRGNDIYGVTGGFTNLSAFMPYYTEADSALWFVNPRLMITDQGRGAANIGFGHRAYAQDLDRVFSFSTWYDYDTGHSGEYHQLGASFAAIGRNMTFRANGNWVVSQDETDLGFVPTGSSRLVDGVVVRDVIRMTEVAYNQADFEISTPMPLLGRYGCEWGAGAYFLSGSDGRDATGVSARVESQITEDLWVNAILTNDKVFDTNVSVNFELTIPNAPPSRYFKRNKVRDSLLASDRRYYRVATDVVSRRDTVAVMMDNGDNGMQMLRLAIIDPNIVDDPDLAFGGTGTENDPFLSVADYMSQDVTVRDDFSIVYVRRRDDDTDTNLNTTIGLLDLQALLGEGIEHNLVNMGVTGLTLPGSTDGLAVPILSNSMAEGMNVVTLANANQVSGFTIDAGGTADGIVGIGIDGFAVTDNTIQNSINGIRIASNTTGLIGTNYGFIQNNVITGRVPTVENPANSLNGVLIDHTAGSLDLLVDSNVVTGILGDEASGPGTGINVTASGPGAEINARNFNALTRVTGFT
ncbi:MAG: hypothetical protein KDA52_17170, partial [Planctomycetaceae bacterium]|nr:hypothetical protein [Planctomycetaceae bacterium]